MQIRETLAREVGAHRRQAEKELGERTDRLVRHEQRIRGLIEMQIDGDNSPTVKEMRRDFEAQAVQERSAIDGLKAELAAPLKLPTPWELGEDRALGLDALHEAKGDQLGPAREQLKSLLGGGTIHLHPKPADDPSHKAHYLARGELLPLGLLIPTKPKTPSDFLGERSGSTHCLRVVARA